MGTSIIALAHLPKSAMRPVMGAVVASSLIFSWAFGDMPFSRKFDASLFITQPRYSLFVRQLVRIAPDARVSAENGFPSHLAERRSIYDFNFPRVNDAECVVIAYAGTNYNLST